MSSDPRDLYRLLDAAGVAGSVAARLQRRDERLPGISVVTETSIPANFERMAKCLPPCGEVLVDKIVGTHEPEVRRLADADGWTVHAGSFKRGVAASVSTHVLLLPGGARLQPAALELLWERRSHPLVATIPIFEGHPVYTGGAFYQHDLTPQLVCEPQAVREDCYYTWAPLGAWLVARPLWDYLGGLDARADDMGGVVDFGLRACEAGWRTLVAHGARVETMPPRLPLPNRFVATWLTSGRLHRLFGLVTEPAAPPLGPAAPG